MFEQGEILFENVFIDGTKIEVNTNKYTFVWKKSINKNEEKIFLKINALVANINMIELTNFMVTKETFIENISIILDWLSQQRLDRKIEFVHGIGRRKTNVQKWIEQLEESKTWQ